MKTILGFFTEDNGHLSSTRLMAFQIVNTGLFLAMYGVISGKADAALIALVLSLVSMGFTAKLVQKPLEEKTDGATKQ